nr:mandelate racemase/muconate lactonizing enzyme family protein [Ancylobacter gelatini]
MFKDLKIHTIEAIPLSYRLPEKHVIRRGIGRPIKRDCVIVKVTTECGVVGYGEAHHGRSPTTVATLVNTTMSFLAEGHSAASTVAVWDACYRGQIATHGLGAGSYIALSGIDMALWDARAKYLGVPVYALMGGTAKKVPAYAGGVSLGFKELPEYMEEITALYEKGYRAVKLRFGDARHMDLKRLCAVREKYPDIAIMVDANSSYSLDDVRYAAPVLAENRVTWFEEPFPAQDYRSYREAKAIVRTPLAAGENHYGRFEFNRLIEDGSVTVMQPDLSKSGGPTEVLRISHLLSTWKFKVNPHSSITTLNHSAAIHLLCSIDNGGYFEADAAETNDLRDLLGSAPIQVDQEGFVVPPPGNGFGIEIDETAFARFPAISGPAYI